MTPYQVFTTNERPNLMDRAIEQTDAEWPEFILHDPTSNPHWMKLYTLYPDYQFTLCDVDGNLVAMGNSVPVYWDGTVSGLPNRGWDGVILQAFEHPPETPNTLSALAAIVFGENRGRGISTHVIQAMRTIATRHNLTQGLIAPVRPSLKARYPLIDIADYVEWTHDKDAALPFDPWLRVHVRLGAQRIGIAYDSMTITGTVAEWEQWTDIRFPQSGQYVIEGGLVPLTIDHPRDLGRYVEPNVWMHHRL